jgi:hypothetical protein
MRKPSASSLQRLDRQLAQQLCGVNMQQHRVAFGEPASVTLLLCKGGGVLAKGNNNRWYDATIALYASLRANPCHSLVYKG